MFRLVFVLSLAAVLAAALTALPDEAAGCAMVRPLLRPGVMAPPRIQVAAESAIIVWDAAKKHRAFHSPRFV